MSVDNIKVEGHQAEIHFLSETALHYWRPEEENDIERSFVPPQTPNSEYNFTVATPHFPKVLRSAEDLEIPVVREKGVKFCIDALGAFFHCNSYKANLLQFWFLDVLIDCLWTIQDDFQLPLEHQKIVLTWLLYAIDLLRDPQKNISRKQFFTTFKEAILLAAEVIEEGCDVVPTPDKLFALVEDTNELESCSSSNTPSELSSLEVNKSDFDYESCIELKEDEQSRLYALPKETCSCVKYDLLSVASISESNTLTKNSEECNKTVGDEEDEVNFYQANKDTPPRFFSFVEETENKSFEEESEKPTFHKQTCKINNRLSSTAEDFYDINEVLDGFVLRRTSDGSESSKHFYESTGSDTSKLNTHSSESTTLHPKVTVQRNSFPTSGVSKERDYKQILKDLAFQKLWEQRMQDMENPKKGWIPTADEISASIHKSESLNEEEIPEEDTNDNEWVDITLEQGDEYIRMEQDTLIVNFGVLRAIIDLIFKYFYESFQFALIKLAFQATPEVIFQKVNQKWSIPKKIKKELQKPKPVKEKKKKGKSPKGSKKDKGKKGKGKDKSSKKSEKKGKKASQKSSKSDSKKGKGKKEKPKKLTKAEKKELERQRREQARLEEELRLMEENKKFMLPLTDAATDELFQSIFENWVKPKGKGKGKGDKKDKGKKKK